MPFTSHLAELRSRLIKCFLALAVAFSGCFPLADNIFAFLAGPLKRLEVPGLTLVGTSVTEAFFTKMKVAFAAALIVALPVLLWQAWQFVAPGLYEHEKRYTRSFVAFGSLFFFAGAIFGYEVVIGQGLGFLLRRYAAMAGKELLQRVQVASFDAACRIVAANLGVAILPRRVAAYGLPDCLRITIAEEGAVKACAAALEEFVKGAATQ